MKRYEVLAASSMNIIISFDVMPYVLQIGTNISEKFASFIFKI
jgi:hypothetical protein